MKGYIKIEAAAHEGREGLTIETDLEHVSNMDRMQMLHSLCRSLEITPTELKLMAMLMQEGIMDEVAEVETLRDDSVRAEGSEKKCTCGECTCDKPNVHIIGGDAGDMIELLKMLLK